MKELAKQLKPVTSSIYFKIAVIVIIVIVAWLIINKLKSLFNSKDDYTRELNRETNQNNLSFSNTEFQNFAERIYDACDGAGTNSEVIFDILNKLKTKDDWNKLVSAFGIRKIGSGYTILAPWQFFTNEPVNLMQALTDEFDAEEQQQLSMILNNIGVAY